MAQPPGTGLQVWELAFSRGQGLTNPHPAPLARCDPPRPGRRGWSLRGLGPAGPGAGFLGARGPGGLPAQRFRMRAGAQLGSSRWSWRSWSRRPESAQVPRWHRRPGRCRGGSPGRAPKGWAVVRLDGGSGPPRPGPARALELLPGCLGPRPRQAPGQGHPPRLPALRPLGFRPGPRARPAGSVHRRWGDAAGAGRWWSQPGGLGPWPWR